MKDIREDSDAYLISLVEVYKRIKDKRKFIFKIIVAFVCIGLFIYFYKQNKEYAVSGEMTIKVRTADSIMDKTMCGLVWKLDSGENFLPNAALYQNLVYSAPFLKELLVAEIQPGVSVADYLIRKRCSFRTFINRYTVGLPQTIFGKEQVDLSYKPGGALEDDNGDLSEVGCYYRAILQQHITFTQQNQTKMPLITVKADAPSAANTLLTEIQRLLSKYTSEYWVVTQKFKLEQVGSCYEEAMKLFTQKQLLLEEQKKNKIVNGVIAEFQEKKIENECQILLSNAFDLQKKMLTLQTVLENERPILITGNGQDYASVKELNTHSGIFMILIFSIFLGGFIGINLVFILPIIAYITGSSWLKKWNRID